MCRPPKDRPGHDPQCRSLSAVVDMDSAVDVQLERQRTEPTHPESQGICAFAIDLELERATLTINTLDLAGAISRSCFEALGVRETPRLPIQIHPAIERCEG